ncbi:MAG: hypothetical protein ABIY70_03095 [Capsulimonas sp.]|uniref:hypothetical protein n=1 Tax=Capsulimonas sp. TaxID=2494211 RepID=UPI0032647FEA
MNIAQEQKTKMTRGVFYTGIQSFVRLIMLTAWALLIIVIGGVVNAANHKPFLNEWKDHFMSYGGFGLLAVFGDLIPYPRTIKKAALLLVVLVAAIGVGLWYGPRCSCNAAQPCSAAKSAAAPSQR